LCEDIVKNRRIWRLAALTVLVPILAGAAQRQAAPPSSRASIDRLMTAAELAGLPVQAPDRRIAYGPDANQYGELRVPAGTGPHPLVILIHGGCFKAGATAHYFGAMGDALKSDAIATWNIEYRRLGQPGGGWPGTFLDVGQGVDHVRAIAGEYHLDLGRVVVVGHSAGGHLATWTAARHRLTKASDLYVADPLEVRGVMDLAGPVDLATHVPAIENECGDTTFTSLLGGAPAAVPEHYAQGSATKLVPLGVPRCSC
jgi:acetyl esterase/lipase